MAADGLTSELLNRNFGRIDSALAARIAATPLPSSPVLGGGHPATPTIGLAYSTDASLNSTWEALDGLFATPTVLKPIRFTDTEVVNRNIYKVINAFLALGVVPVLATYDATAAEPDLGPERPAPPEPEEPEQEPEPEPEPEPEQTS